MLSIDLIDVITSKITNGQVLDLIGEKRTLLNNILRRKPNWIGHILRRNCLLHDAIEGQMMEVKGVGRRRIQLLDDLEREEDIGILRRMLKVEKDGNDSLSIEHMYFP